jgi:parallel beta-helix repeat protein
MIANCVSTGEAYAQFTPQSGGVSLSARLPEDAEKSFLQWSAIASAQTTSPANAESGDYARQWAAPDGRSIKLVVKVPHPRIGASEVKLTNVPEGEDARPYFEAALERVKVKGAGRFVIPPGTYTFKSLAIETPAHLILKNLSDLTIEGTGATLVFTQNQPGLYINSSKRLRVKGLTLDYAMRTSSIGTIVNRDGQNALLIDSKYPVTASDAVYFVSEYDPAKRQWVQGGQRSIMPPDSPNPAVYVGNQTYASAAFKNIKAGKNYVVFHHWYGGPAIRIDDMPGPNQSEDIVIDSITLHSAPGMGIFAYGIKRGLAIINSSIVPRPDGSNPVSTEYDAIHVQLGGGDILINGNHIAGQGDDGINLNNAVHPIVSIADQGRTLVLSKYSRFISAGDALAFFDDSGGYLGQAKVTDKPKALGGLNNQISLDHAIPGISPSSVVRDIALISSRFDVSGNTIEACNCHGVLVQLPNGRVEGNTFRNLRANAVRLLTDVGSWKEGVGAFNVIVSRNNISNSGIDNSLPLPWAAISAYGGARGNLVSATPVNRYLDVIDNTISDSKQGCITIASSRDVKVKGNTCNSTNKQTPSRESLNILQSTGVTLIRNKRTGMSTGGIKTDSTTTNSVDAQSAY